MRRKLDQQITSITGRSRLITACIIEDMMEAKEPRVQEILAEAELNFKCPVRRGLLYMGKFASSPICGRCLPCSLGSYEAGERLRKLADGKGAEADLLALRRIMNQMIVGSLCKKGKDTGRFVLEGMSTGIYEEHIEGRCSDRECVSLMEYRVIPDKCVMCGICKEICSYRAVICKNHAQGGLHQVQSGEAGIDAEDTGGFTPISFR